MIPFTGNPLDRLSAARTEQARITTYRCDPASAVLPFHRMEPLCQQATPAIAFLTVAACPIGDDAPFVFLGVDAGRAYFAIDIADAAQAEALRAFGAFKDLRGQAPLLPPGELAIASQAKGMLEWHARTHFCGRCGAPTRLADAGHRRQCPSCQAEEFPRTDPAVIMLATCDERCLLARNVKWAPDFLSTLAGFVEPGEGLEEAVTRELFEEAGVKTRSVRYFASQPWPFPAALMLGFFADVETPDIRLDPSEIAEAFWFTKSEARALLAGTLEGRRGPMTAAIAWHLISVWAGE